MTNEEIEKIDELVMSKSMAKRIAAQGATTEDIKRIQELLRAEKEIQAELQDIDVKEKFDKDFDEFVGKSISAVQEKMRAAVERAFKGDFVSKAKIIDNAEVSTLATIAWAINEAGKRAHDNAVAKGFYENPPSDLERIALIHSEISEAAEALRQKEMPRDQHCPEFSAVEIEYADSIIRILDHARYRGWDIGRALIAKMGYNSARPYKHNKTC